VTGFCQGCAVVGELRAVAFLGVALASKTCDACLAPLWARIAEERLVAEESIAAGVSWVAAAQATLARLTGTAVAS
jgi:hypothetical protein